jgi:hypothetical protein
MFRVVLKLPEKCDSGFGLLDERKNVGSLESQCSAMMLVAD